MWQVSVIHNAQANSFSFSLYSAGCQGSRTAGRKLQWLSLLPCNSIRKASMKSIFIAPAQNCAAQWNDNEKVHKGDGLNDKFLKMCCSGWPSVRLANTHGHMGLYPQGFTPIPCHLYPGQTADCESKGISWYTVLGCPIQLFCISEGKEDVFLKHPGPKGTYDLLDHRQCGSKGRGAGTPKPRRKAQSEKSREKTSSTRWKCRRAAPLCFQSKAALGPCNHENLKHLCFKLMSTWEMLNLVLQLPRKEISHWRRALRDFLSSLFSTLLVTRKCVVIYFVNIIVFGFKDNEWLK